jgi:hypothetical protein
MAGHTTSGEARGAKGYQTIGSSRTHQIRYKASPPFRRASRRQSAYHTHDGPIAADPHELSSHGGSGCLLYLSRDPPAPPTEAREVRSRFFAFDIYTPPDLFTVVYIVVVHTAHTSISLLAQLVERYTSINLEHLRDCDM